MNNTVLKWCIGALLLTGVALAGAPKLIRFKQLTPDEGLSQANVKTIVEDDLGQMWFGTLDGLNKYDGNNFTIYRHHPEDSASISASYISSAFKDHDGSLWFGTSQGLSYYNARLDQFVNFPLNKYLDDPSLPVNVQAIARYQDKLLLGTDRCGLIVLDPKSGEYEGFSHRGEDPGTLAGNDIRSLLVDRSGRIWVGTTVGVHRFDPDRETFTRYLLAGAPGERVSNDIRQLAEDPDGGIWIGTYGSGIARLGQESEGYKFSVRISTAGSSSRLSNNLIMGLSVSPEGLWIGTENGGLNFLDWETKAVTVFKNDPYNPESLNNNSVYAVYEDQAGNIWLGTYAGGINVAFHSQQAIRVYRAVPGGVNTLSYNSVLNFCQTRDGRVWIATDGGGINIYDPATNKFEILNARNANLPRDAVLYIFEDSRGTVWVGTWDGGLSRYNPATGKFTTYDKNNSDLAGNNIFCILEDEEGHLWLMAIFTGLIEFDPVSEKVLRTFTPQNSGMRTAVARQIIRCSNGDIAMVTQDGLHFVEPRSGLVRAVGFEAENPVTLSDNFIMGILEDSPGVFWVGTRNGLNLYNRQTGEVRSFYEKDGLPNNTIKGILKAGNGDVWLSTNLGLSRLHPESGVFRNYRLSEGLQGNEFNEAAAYQSRDGLLWFGGVKGMNVFDPKALVENSRKPPVILTQLELFNKPVRILGGDSLLSQHISYTRDLTLSYRESVFSFSFSALDFTAPEANQYAYMMQGFDSEWRNVGNERKATYTSLDPGIYTFRVKASNNDGYWNESGVSLELTITPPFWQTGWFYTAVLLAVGLLIFSTYKYRVRSIQAHNQLLGREVQARTRELLTQKEELEDSLRIRERIEQELRVQKEKAEAASKSKSEFLANMSHEIRTPMNGVIGMTDLLLETHLTHDQHDLAKTVMSSANSLLNIIDDILDFSKIEAGKIELEEIELDLLEVVESVSAILAPKAHEKNLEYFLITAPELPVHYYGDPVRLRQVIINLVNNAIKFTHKGEIILMVTEEATEGQTTTLRFSVRDTGIGIPKDRLNRLFKSFSQVDSSVTRQYGGTGLGLAISKSLAELMGGEIGVNSQEGEGSEFWFTIRLRKQANAVSRTFDPGLLRGHRVLIVDDHPVNRHLLIEHFKGTDCELQVAEHGGEAWHKLQKAQKSGEPFTICISDYWMPVMDGEELVRRVRADSRFENLKMMLITASISRGDLHKVVEAGYDSYMMKPITRRRMWANLANLIGADPSTNGLRESISESQTPARQAGRLLLVEDNKVNQKVAQKMLENLGYGVDIAGDGVEALKAVDHQTYDLIFMDIQMPNLDGLSATRAIREKESDQPPVPIVALTANAMKGDREKCLEAGMNDYLSKPFKKKELLEILNKFFA